MEAQLRRAVLDGELQRVRQLVRHDLALDMQFEHGDTALHLAALLGDFRAVEVLLNAGADATICNDDGFTPAVVAKRAGFDQVYNWFRRVAEVAPTMRDAIRNSDMVTVRKGFGVGFSVDWRFKKGRTALHLAASRGNDLMVSCLLDAGADTTIVDKKGHTPKHLASRTRHPQTAQLLRQAKTFQSPATTFRDAVIEGNVERVEVLLARGVGVNTQFQSHGGRTALHLAAVRSDHRMVDMLLDRKADATIIDHTGRNALHQALHVRDYHIVDRLLCAGVDPNVPDPFNGPLLLAAVMIGDVEPVQLLLLAGANPDIHDRSGESVLMAASEQGQWKIVSLLVGAGANLSVQNSAGATPLHVAASANCIEAVEMLTKAGVDPNVPMQDGSTPLECAVKRGSADQIMRLLVEAGADVNAKNNDGWTSLHHAVYAGRCELVQYLLCAGADPSSMTENGETPLHIAATTDAVHVWNVTRSLLHGGAPINAQDHSGATPLFMVIEHCPTELKFRMAKFLIDKGASINKPLMTGRTVLHEAAACNNVKLVRYLLASGADIHVKDKDPGFSPLMAAVCSDGCAFDVIRELVAVGAELSSIPKRAVVHDRIRCRRNLVVATELMRQRMLGVRPLARVPTSFAGVNVQTILSFFDKENERWKQQQAAQKALLMPEDEEVVQQRCGRANSCKVQ